MSVSDTRSPVPPFSETRSPVPLLYRRHSSGEIRNLASISSSLLPAFGTVVGEGSVNLKKFVIAPYDRRYRSVFIQFPYLFFFMTQNLTNLFSLFSFLFHHSLHNHHRLRLCYVYLFSSKSFSPLVS